MADRCQASITIGGTLSAVLLTAFVETIQDEALSTEWDGFLFEATELPVEQPLRLMADDVAWGQSRRLEEFCIERGLPFARWSGACPGAYDAERAVFTGSGELQHYPATDDDDVMICRRTAETPGSYDAITAYFDAGDFVVPPLVTTG